MSVFIDDLREMRGGLASRVRRLGTMARRTTAVPLGLRLVTWLWAILATLVAYPPPVLSSPRAVPLLLVGGMAAVAPRTRTVTIVALVPIVGWLISTAGFGTPVSAGRLLTLASALYLLHTTAALTAQLPYDAIVAPGVVLRWLGRTGIVLAGTVVVGLWVLAAGQQLGGPVTLLATALGLGVAVGLAALLTWLLRR